MASSETRGESTLQARRKAAMAVLAHSDAAEISGRLASLAVPEHQDLRGGENGLVMLRGRIGGDGAPFNLGEATVSRAAVRLATAGKGEKEPVASNANEAGRQLNRRVEIYVEPVREG